MPTSARDLFARALDLNPEEREAFLAAECGDNAELRLAVQRLLVDSERALSFFAGDDGATIFDAGGFGDSFTEAEGDVVGPYTLRQQIGEGGFGVVWMAEQSEPISRMVALKVVKAGMDTRQVLSRFEAERQAVAMMDHPNIAKVLDAGATSTGRPYFAMELVKGMPITEFCEQQKFGPRQRLELFKDVCAAVQHAHQKGVIHRDLKPSNIMVTLAADVPVVKVIDFGIAKATQNKLTEKTLFTRFEQFLGTPVYMSPEQAAMSAIDIDTRSDIYSLGVLLYELLAGAPPFDQKSLLSAGYDEMRRIIAEDEPPKPSTRCTQTQANTATTTGSKGKKAILNPNALKGELDWIVMKAIEKDRTRRYETANAFAADIGRYLSDEPVQAAAPSATYKFRKFARRNKAAFTVAAAMVVLLLVGIATTSWQAVRATAESERANAERNRATAEQKLAEEERDRANAAEQLAAVRLVESEKAREEAEGVSSFLTGMFESSRPGEEKGGREVKVADVLDRAVEKLETELADQPERRAMLQATLGRTYLALGLASKAIPLQEKVRDYFLAAYGPEHLDTIAAMGNLGNSYFDDGRWDEALEIREEALPLSHRVHGPEHPVTLGSMHNLAISFDAAGRPAEALKMHEEVLGLFRKVLGPEHPATISVMGFLASSYFDAGRRDEALEMGEEVLALSHKVHGPDHPETLIAMNNLADSYHEVGRRDEALEMREEVLPLSRKVNGPVHPDTLHAMTTLASSYFAAGRRDEALKLREELLPLFRKGLGPEHGATLSAMNNLASQYYDAGRRDEALKLREEVLPLFRKALGPGHPDTLRTMQNLAISYRDAGRRDETLKLREEVLPLSSKVNGQEHPDTLGAMTNLANSYSDVGRLGEAIALEEKTLEIKKRVLPPAHPFLSVAMASLANFYSAANRNEEALKLCEELLALSLKVNGPEYPNTLMAMNKLANSYEAADHLDEALKLREELLPLYRKVLGPEHPATGEVAAQLGFLLDKVGAEKNDNDKKTIKALQEAVRINPKNANVQYWLGILLVRTNRLEEAVVTLRAASELHPAGPRGVEMRERLLKALTDLGRGEEAKEVRRALAALPGHVAKDSPVVLAVIVTPTSEWKWLHPADGTDPQESNPDFHQTFFSAGYDDASWQTGKDSDQRGGGFGYGDDWFKGVDIGTPASKEVGKSAYFRHRFTTTKEHAHLELHCQRDDGLIIYLDGKEVARDNMEEGEEAYHLPAASAVSTFDETITYRIPLEGITLPAGEHLLAISLHNPKDPSSDLRIGGITLVEREPPLLKPNVAIAENQAPDAGPPALPAPAKTKEIEFLEDILSSTLLIHDENHQYTLAAKAKLAAALRANGDELAAAKLAKEIADSKARAEAAATHQ